MKKNVRILLVTGGGLTMLYAGMKAAAEYFMEDCSIDSDNPYLCNAVSSDLGADEKEGDSLSLYGKSVKPVLDQVFSFLGLTVLSPLYFFIAAVVYLDDPGPVFFAQKRVGKDGHFFMLHKYRSMKVSAPHDVPTHKLEEADQYLTKAGRILRRTSLDELPQIWDIFRGRMSLVGPRPALWNQKDLVLERKKYGVNALLPGLTGLAQIRGRDELLIAEKARIDGVYASIIQNGGSRAFRQDISCLFGTVLPVVRRDGIVEGKPLCTDFSCCKHFSINQNARKKVLITGAGSYIGQSFERWSKSHYPNIETAVIDMKDGAWQEHDFSQYDAVFHVAGIAHADAGCRDPKAAAKYYSVNRDLAVKTCQKAKDSGVRQFLLMSSMLIYGTCAAYGKKRVITDTTKPAPDSYYADSKWKADKGVRALADENFNVAVLRSPMIYGKGAKGNYKRLSKAAKIMPVFPDVNNQRSMLYIDNLCEFVCLLVLSEEGGVYFPQNQTYTCTAEMVKQIASVACRPIRLWKGLRPFVAVVSHLPGKTGRLINKVFGNCVYDQRISQYDGLFYQVVGLEESIRETECADIRQVKTIK